MIKFITLILLPIFLYSGAYYDLCNGKEYTVGKSKYIKLDAKDQKNPPFAVFIYCTDKKMTFTLKPSDFMIFEISGKKYNLHFTDVNAKQDSISAKSTSAHK